jgi:hypothetical protein
MVDDSADAGQINWATENFHAFAVLVMKRAGSVAKVPFG